MKKELLEQNFLVLRELIPPDEAKEIGKQFKENCETIKFPGDTQAKNSHSVYNYKEALELLCNMTNDISKIIEEPVLPTYTYGRIYKENSVLRKHTDRPACEVSITLHLDGDHVWPIWIQNQKGRSHCVELKSGDALLYLGCIAPHWRDEFDGSWYAQFFMHYVRSNGPAAECYFDAEKIEGGRKDEIVDALIDESIDQTPIPKHLTNRYFDGILLSERDCDAVPNNEQIKQQINHEEEKEMNSTEEKSILQILEEKKNRLKRRNSTQVEETTSVESAFVRFDKKEKSENKSDSSCKKLDDYIRVYEGALPYNICDDILNEYVTTDDWSPAMTGGGLDQNARNCDVIGTSHRNIMDKNFNYRKMLDEKIYNCINTYMQKYESECATEGLCISQDTGYELLRYREGQFYVQHTDHFKQNPRVLSCSICLNDDYEGGEFAFFDRTIKFKPKKGSVIMFPSNFMFPHEVMPVVTGNRYAIITWLV